MLKKCLNSPGKKIRSPTERGTGNAGSRVTAINKSGIHSKAIKQYFRHRFPVALHDFLLVQLSMSESKIQEGGVSVCSNANAAGDEKEK